MQATEIKHVSRDAAPRNTETSGDVSSRPCYESDDQAKTDAEILGQIYSLTGAGS